MNKLGQKALCLKLKSCVPPCGGGLELFMSRMVGTVSRGVRAPIIRSGDDLVEIVTKSVLEAAAQPEDGFAIRDRDVVAMTEAIVARAQGNYASVDDIAADVKEKLGGETVGVIFPILSRNRFAVCLRGIAKGAKKIVLMLSYPSDEVGNHLIDPDVMDEKGVDPYRDVLTLEKYRELFGYTVHPFTGVDYVAYYMDLIRESGAEAEVIFANDAKAILPYTKNVINCDIHTRKRTKRRLIAAGAEKVFSLDEILTAPVNGSGYNENYGLLGTNKATEDTVKLFPRDCQSMVEAIQKKLYDATGKHVEVMVYGDGAFKDPVGKIWELADPVVSPEAHQLRPLLLGLAQVLTGQGDVFFLVAGPSGHLDHCDFHVSPPFLYICKALLSQVRSPVPKQY